MDLSVAANTGTCGCQCAAVPEQMSDVRGGVFVSSNFIRNKSSYSDVSNDYAHYPVEDTNNTPAIRVFVRLASDDAKFVINNKVAPRLLLKRDQKYQFNVVTPGKPFCFFDAQKRELTQASDYTVFGFHPTQQTPGEFFYGCSSDASMIGKVKLI